MTLIMRDQLARFSIAILGVGAGAAVWLGSASYDHYVLGLGSFIDCLFAAPEATMAARIAALATAVGVGAGGQVLANRISANRRIRTLFERSNDGLVLLDPVTGTVVDSNGRASEFLGYSPSELKNLSLSAIHPHDYAVAEDFVKRVLCDGSGITDEVSCRRKNGELMPAEVSASAFDLDGKMYVLACIRDISDRLKAEQEREQARREAEIANRAKSEFLAIMSHELRTPLNAILGFSDMISREQLGAHQIPAYREYAQHIYSAGDHLLGVIGDILDLTRIESGTEQVTPRRVDAEAVCRGLTSMLVTQAGDAGLTLKLDLEKDMPALWADERKMKQVLVNLMANSIKFTEPGGVITLACRMGKAGCCHVFEVRDTGIGIAEENIEQAFEPFTQVSGNNAMGRNFDGIGLGLPLSKRLIEQHGGSIEMASTVGKGTVVKICMPVHEVPTEMAPGPV